METDRLTTMQLPDGATLMCEVAIVGYIDADGDFAWGWMNKGSQTLSEPLGLLQLAQHALARRAFE